MLRHPLVLALLLAVPLWIALDNFIIAFAVALLLSVFLAMCRALYQQRKSRPPR